MAHLLRRHELQADAEEGCLLGIVAKSMPTRFCVGRLGALGHDAINSWIDAYHVGTK